MAHSSLIDVRVIAQAFNNSIQVLGPTSVDLLIHNLKHYGVYFDNPSFDLQQMSNAIGDILGEEAASLIYERFNLELNRLTGLRDF